VKRAQELVVPEVAIDGALGDAQQMGWIDPVDRS
jgi:hypothetical protein